MSGVALTHGFDWPPFRVGGIIAFVVGTLFLAGAIHVCTILLVPVFAKSDGWSRLAPYAGEDQFAELPIAGTPDVKGVAGLDPLFVNAACRLHLGDNPAGITVAESDRLWSLALYDPNGVIIFSLNDRTAVEGRLDMIVVNAGQNALLKKSPPLELETSIVTESPSDDLIALLRLYAPTRTAREDAKRIMAEAECLPAPSVIPPTSSGG